MKNRTLFFSIFAIFCLGVTMGCRSDVKDTSFDKQKPNILFILVDDMGWRDTGTYGSTFYETPHIDTLADQGMKFNDAYANAPVCSPSRYAIQTGKYPADIHLTDWIPGLQIRYGVKDWQKVVDTSNTQRMPLSQTTMGEELKGAGYKTFFAGKWHLGDDPKYWPEHQGYDINKGGWAAGSPVSHGEGGYFSPYHNPRLKDGPKGEYLPNRLTDETIKFIKDEKKKDQPFFAFLSFYSVHTPLQSKAKLIQKYKDKAQKRGLNDKKTYDRSKPWMQRNSRLKERLIQSNPTYAAMVQSVDNNVGRLMSMLKQNGLKNNTIVVFFSDNGGLAVSSTTNLPLKYGKGWTYEGGVRVPMIVRWPHHTTPGSVSHVPVSGVDCFPTLMDIAGLDVSTSNLDGKSLVPLLEGGKPEQLTNRPIFWHYPHYHGAGARPASAVRRGDYKLIKFWEDHHVELYNLNKDIGEHHDLSEKMPEKTAELKEDLTQWLNSTSAIIPHRNPQYDPNY